MRLIETEQQGKNLILGGAVLGGGGGGCVEEAIQILNWAVSRKPVKIINPEEMDPGARVATVALVGPPSTRQSYPRPEAFISAWELLQDNFPHKIEGIITNENGGYASINGFCQGVAFDLPVVDVPCNGRAHPLGLMGAMGLHKIKDYESFQAGVSQNNADQSNRIFFQGEIELGSRMIVEMASAYNTMVAVARNPVRLDYAIKNGAPGALEQAYGLGEKLMTALDGGGEKVAQMAARGLKGQYLGQGQIKRKKIQQIGGLDLGRFFVAGLDLDIIFYNEFISLKSPHQEIKFPDLITIFDLETGWPQPAFALREDQEVALLAVPGDQLILGAGAKDQELERMMEEKTGAVE